MVKDQMLSFSDQAQDGMSALATSTQYIGGSSQGNQAKKTNKKHPNWKEKSNTISVYS